MYSYLFSPFFSIITRGLVICFILILTVLLFYGYIPLLNRDVLTHLVIETSVLSEKDTLLFKYLVPVILLFLIPIYLRKRELYIGLIQSASTYSTILLITIILCNLYVIYYKYIYVKDYSIELYCLTTSLLLILVNVVLTNIYPLIAIDFARVNRSGGFELIRVKTNTIMLNSGEVVRVIVYGDYSNIGIRSTPENSAKISNWEKTLLYKYIDIYPASSFGSYIELFFKDKLIYRFKCIYSSIDHKKIKFNIYFNDDYIDSYELNVETFKNIKESIEPILESIPSRIGINRSEISNIVFYTKDKVHIPSETTIADLINIDEVDVMIYSIEKYMEIYKYYGKKDVYELWETLVKRLEFLHREMSSLLNDIENSVYKIKSLYSNWW